MSPVIQVQYYFAEPEFMINLQYLYIYGIFNNIFSMKFVEGEFYYGSGITKKENVPLLPGGYCQRTF